MERELQPHIRLTQEQAANYAVLPGDPGRVKRIATFLDGVEELAYNREFCSIRGKYKGVPVLAVSTGIGGPSTGIAVEELSKIGVKTMIRIGSCGALQYNMKVGDLIIAQGAVRDEGTSKTSIDPSYPAVTDNDVMFAILRCARELNYRHYCGIIRSHDSFYTDRENEIDDYWSKMGVLAADMETAALFVIGKLRKVRTGSILNVVTERTASLEQSINDYASGEQLAAMGEEREITLALETFAFLNSLESPSA
jgi:uridine phosphorylase